MRGGFDIEKFLAVSGKVELDDIPWDDVPAHPLHPAAIRTLRYFLQTESATFFYLRGFLMTRVVEEEPDLAPFLCTWAYEEEFHGIAFRRFLQAYGEPVDDGARIAAFARRGLGERIDEVGSRLASSLFRDTFPTAHMVWGAIQELTTHVAYRELIRRTEHPVLHTICHRIMKQEARHFAFFYHAAHERLARGKAHQTVTKGVLKLAWTPVGDGVCTRSEVKHSLRFLFDGNHGPAVAAIEERIRELPGMGWFDLFRRYVDRAAIAPAPPAWLPA